MPKNGCGNLYTALGSSGHYTSISPLKIGKSIEHSIQRRRSNVPSKGVFEWRLAKLLALSVPLNLATSNLVYGFDWSSTDVQLLYGNDYEFGVDERTTVTVEHSDGWKYGTNYFFVDTIDRSDIGVEAYAEVYSYLSLNKISGLNLSVGPVHDISLVAGLNIGNQPEQDHFKAYLFGVSFDLSNPLFDYLQLDITAYKADSVKGRYGMQFTPVWSIPFAIGPVDFKFRGFADFVTGNANATGNYHILTQPQVLLDIGSLAGWKKNSVYIGTEYSFWHNKFGVKGVDESVVQAMIIGFF